MSDGWIRVSKENPCPICKKIDYCCLGHKGVNCMRVESAKQLHNGGWMHFFGDDSPPYVPPPPNPEAKSKHPVDCERLLKLWKRDTSDGLIFQIAEDLGVSIKALAMLGTSWAAEYNAVAFPMYDARCWNGTRPIGFRLRTMDGNKFSVKGGKSGIFFPYGALMTIRCQTIYICEGPTDTAACLDLGLFAIGRSSCRGQEDIMLDALSQLIPKDVILISDNDGPGVAGAVQLLDKITFRKTLITPPCKDMRTFVKAGGTAADLQCQIDSVVATL